jgi:hypothetical protein
MFSFCCSLLLVLPTEQLQMMEQIAGISSSRIKDTIKLAPPAVGLHFSATPFTLR